MTPRLSPERLAQIERTNASIPHQLEVELLAELREVTRERDEWKLAFAAFKPDALAEIQRLIAEVERLKEAGRTLVANTFSKSDEMDALRARVAQLEEAIARAAVYPGDEKGKGV